MDKELEQLPPDRLRKVLQFVRSVRRRDAVPSRRREAARKPSAEDPVAELVGMVAHGRLAHDVDRELYGPQG